MPFLFPVHKLFAGSECLFQDDGTPLAVPAIKFVETPKPSKTSFAERTA